uniref:Uncharacterized protein n=1 Tax=Micrurus surinamensis TaxID=129470 RepID=A0A2D4PUI5_MICSU
MTIYYSIRFLPTEPNKAILSTIAILTLKKILYHCSLPYLDPTQYLDWGNIVLWGKIYLSTETLHLLTLSGHLKEYRKYQGLKLHSTYITTHNLGKFENKQS